LDFAVANARSANANSLPCPFDQGVDALEIQIPAPLRHIMGVADLMSELRTPATDFTNFCHDTLRLSTG